MTKIRPEPATTALPKRYLYKYLKTHYKQFSKKTIFSLSIATTLLTQGLNSAAQTITFTSSPASEASEYVEYSSSVSASIGNGASLEFSSEGLPSWLTLTNTGLSPVKMNEGTIADPGAVTQDADGNYYVIERSATNKKVYKIKPNGTMTVCATVSGNGNVTGAVVVGQYLYVSMFSGTIGGVLKYDLNQENPLPTVVYAPGYVMGMAYRDGYLYISQYLQNKVGRIRLSDNMYSDYITNGVSGCGGLAFTPSGQLLVALLVSQKVVAYIEGEGGEGGEGREGREGVVVTVLSELPDQPTDVEVDGNGNVYVSFWSSSKIRKYSSDFDSFVEVSGKTTASSAMYAGSAAFVFTDRANGNLYNLQSAATLTGTPSHQDVGTRSFFIGARSGENYNSLIVVLTVLDRTSPQSEGFIPYNNQTGVKVNSKLTMSFAEQIEKGSGKIYIRSSLDNSILESIDVASERVTTNVTDMIITPSNNLPNDAKLYVTIDAGAVRDINGNDFVGISQPETWAFQTAPIPKITFTSVPVTAAVENVAYTGPVMASINSDDELTYSVITKPSWLTLTPPGPSTPVKLNNGPVVSPGGITQDANGTYYVVNGNSKILSVNMFGTTSLFVPILANCYDALVVGDYLYVSYYSGSFLGVRRFFLWDPSSTGEAVYEGRSVASITYKDGYLYAAETTTGNIVKINIETKAHSNYITGITSPWGVAFTPSGDLLVTTFLSAGGKLIKYSDGQPTDLLTGLAYPADIQVDAAGSVYISFNSLPIRKYTPDLSSYDQVSGSRTTTSFVVSPDGKLAFGDRLTGDVYTVKKGGTLDGTPKHQDVGQHLITIRATNGSISEEQQFTITVTDPNPPMVEAYSPRCGATEIALDTTLTVTFDEEIKKGTGKLFIWSRTNDSLLQTIDMADLNVTVSGNVLKVKPASNMPRQTDIYIVMEPGAVKDVNGNDFKGMESSGTWFFRTIEKEAQHIAFVSSKTLTYGDEEIEAGAISDAHLEVSYTSSNESVAIIVDGEIRVKGVGFAEITATQEGNNDYKAAEPVVMALTVQPREITATISESAPVISKVYDGHPKLLLDKEYFALSNLRKGDNVQVSAYAYFDNANAGDNKMVSISLFELGGEDMRNYRLATVSLEATGSITARDITLSMLSENVIRKTYDGTVNASVEGIEPVLDGIIGEDQVTASGKASYADKNAGEKAVTVTDFMLNGESKDNYHLTTSSVTLEGAISPKAIVIAAKNVSKVYGTNDPMLSYRVDGLVEGDEMTGSLARETGKDVGEYAIGAGTLSAGPNYAVEAFTPATFTITPAELVVTAESKTKKQGAANPAFTFSYSGLAEGDQPSDLSTAAVAKTTAATLSPIGDYDILVGGASSRNYNIRYVNGKLSIMPEGNSHIKVWSSSPSELQVRVYSETAQKASLILYTEIGQPVIVQPKQLAVGFNTFTVYVGSLASSMYVMNVNADKFKESQRVKIK